MTRWQIGILFGAFFLNGMTAATAPALSTAGSRPLMTDASKVFAVPQVSKPGYLSPITDPTFGTTITRIANEPGQNTSPVAGTWGSDARHHYAKDQPWNADNTLIAIQNKGASPKHLILDGETYKVKYGPCKNYSVGDDRWHPSPAHADERINVNGSSLEWFDVVKCVPTRSWTLPLVADHFGEGEGNSSFDGRFVALDDHVNMLVVDMDPQPPLASFASGNRRMGPSINISNCGFPGECKVDWVSISPSGKYAIVKYTNSGSIYTRLFDVNPETLALTPHPVSPASPRCGGTADGGFIYSFGHADLTLNPFDHYEDVIIGQAHCPHASAQYPVNSLLMVRLKDGMAQALTETADVAAAHHISTRNYDRPGWVYVTYFYASGKRFSNEIVAVKLDGSKSVERLAHTHSVTSGCYRCEEHGVPSRDGKRVLFTSDWTLNCGTGCGTTSVRQDYVIDARSLSTVSDTLPSAPPQTLAATHVSKPATTD